MLHKERPLAIVLKKNFANSKKKYFTWLRFLTFFRRQYLKKKNNRTFFDVPMGSFHGADICDLVELYIHIKLGKVFSNCGLYRDD